jgi:hypothetical protein
MHTSGLPGGEPNLAERAMLAEGALQQLKAREIEWLARNMDHEIAALNAMRGLAIAIVLAAAMWVGIGLLLWKIFA